MNIYRELAELFKDLSLPNAREHWAVLVLMAWLLFLTIKKKWMPVLFTIGASYLVFYINQEEYFNNETLVYFKVLLFGLIAVSVFGVYVYYLWIGTD